MAHYAKVLNGKVINVIVAEADFFDNFIDNSPGEWIQCSYNTRAGKHYSSLENLTLSEDQSKALRYNFPGIGYNYDNAADAFYSNKPFNSWILDTETYTWNPPVEMPADGNMYDWNEETQSWDQVV